MHELKRIRPESIPRAIAKAERYRLLNEPRAAESICRDVVAVDSGNASAIKILILAITDQFADAAASRGIGKRKDEVQELLAQLPDEYSRRYYAGIMLERWAKGLLAADYERRTIHDVFEQAMGEYEAAEGLADTDNEDAVLRWNTCARIIDRYELGKSDEHSGHDLETFDDEMPVR